MPHVPCGDCENSKVTDRVHDCRDEWHGRLGAVSERTAGMALESAGSLETQEELSVERRIDRRCG